MVLSYEIRKLFGTKTFCQRSSDSGINDISLCRLGGRSLEKRDVGVFKAPASSWRESELWGWWFYRRPFLSMTEYWRNWFQIFSFFGGGRIWVRKDASVTAVRVQMPIYIQLHHKDITDRTLHFYYPRKKKKSISVQMTKNSCRPVEDLADIFGRLFPCSARVREQCIHTPTVSCSVFPPFTLNHPQRPWATLIPINFEWNINAFVFW